MMNLTEQQIETLALRLAENELDSGDPTTILYYYFHSLITGKIDPYTPDQISDLMEQLDI